MNNLVVDLKVNERDGSVFVGFWVRVNEDETQNK